MSPRNRWIRLLVAVFVLGALLGVGTPGEVSAQSPPGKGKPAKQHKWKHDKLKPPGPPCPIADRPCPPGLGTGGLPPGQENRGRDDEGFPPGHSSTLVSAEFFVAGMEPSPVFLEAVGDLRQSRFPMTVPVPAPAQRALFEGLAGEEKPETTPLARALTSRGNDEAMNAAEELITALRQLTVWDGQLPATVEAFNAFVDVSSETFLADPSPEFLVLHSFLGVLVEEARHTRGGNG